ILGGVIAGGNLLPICALADFPSLRLRVGGEKLAVLRAHVIRIRNAAAERFAIGVERGSESAEVGDVFGERQLAVDGEAGKRLVRRELIDERLREFLK